MNGRDARAHATATLWTRRPGGRRGFGAPLATLLLALCVLLCLLGAAVAAGAAPASAPLRPAAQGLQLLPLTFSFGPAGVSLTPGAACLMVAEAGSPRRRRAYVSSARSPCRRFVAFYGGMP